jgi:carbamoyltransferase
VSAWLNSPTEQNYAAFYGGHDASLCIYNKPTDTFHTIELEKLVGIKHVQWPIRTTPGAYKTHTQAGQSKDFYRGDTEAIIFALKNEMMRLGLKPEFKHIVIGSTWGEVSHEYDRWMPLDLLLQAFRVEGFSYHKGHHMAHARCAVMQSPYSQGVWVVTDGGGDDAVFSVGVYDRNTNKFKRTGSTDRKEHNLGGSYNRRAVDYCDSLIQKTPIVNDLAGKVMGAAGYGIPGTELKYKRWHEFADYTAHPLTMSARSYIGENNRYRFLNKEHLTWQEECDICYTIQNELEKEFMQSLYHLMPNIKENLSVYGNNLIMSGGVALNILNNKKIQEELGVNVWVPSNPADNGLSFGMLMEWLVVQRPDLVAYRLQHPNAKVYDLTFSGSSVRDLTSINKYKKIYKTSHSQITLDELATCIKDGEIIALMQGNSEVGFRSLGARSILCDASITGIKDKVNLTKRREAYRPFAPVCLWKDASQYFEVGEDNIYKHMNMAVMVKEEWREKLSSITHVDNTARLQAVEEQDGFMFDLLTKHGGVLLNTSFNLSGKPICNSLYEALHILERSDIDKLVVSDLDNKLVCFEKYKE